MRLEQNPISSFVLTRHHDMQPVGGTSFWEQQLSNPETSQYWWDLTFRVSLSQLGKIEDAEDNTQRTIIDAWTGASGFHGGSPKAWLLRIAVNNGLSKLRKKSGRPEASFEKWQKESGSDLISPDRLDDPEVVCLTEEVATRVRTAVDQLPHLHRETIEKRYYEGLKYEEVAQALEIEKGTVKSRLNRAHSQLAVILQDMA